MENARFAAKCPGTPCPLADKPETHSHLPKMAKETLNTNLEITDEESKRIRDEILGTSSYDGRTSEQRLLEDLEFEFGSLTVGNTTEIQVCL